MEKLKIQIIIGATRPNRFSEKVSLWIYQLAKQRKDINFELVDLKDYPMPFYKEVVKKFADKISQAYGYQAVLKNALDYIYYPWNKKPVGFVS